MREGRKRDERGKVKAETGLSEPIGRSVPGIYMGTTT